MTLFPIRWMSWMGKWIINAWTASGGNTTGSQWDYEFHVVTHILGLVLFNIFTKSWMEEWGEQENMLPNCKGDHRLLDTAPTWRQSWSHRQRRPLSCVFLLERFLFNFWAAAASPHSVLQMVKIPLFCNLWMFQKAFWGSLMKLRTDRLWFIGFLTLLPVQVTAHHL